MKNFIRSIQLLGVYKEYDSRKEYWEFLIIAVVVGVLIYPLSHIKIIGEVILLYIYSILILTFHYATARRLRDLNFKARYVLYPIFIGLLINLLVIFVKAPFGGPDGIEYSIFSSLGFIVSYSICGTIWLFLSIFPSRSKCIKGERQCQQ